MKPTVGLGVLHLFGSVHGHPGHGTPASRPLPTRGRDPAAIIHAVKQAEADGVRVVTVAMLGHKADVGFMALGEDLWRLRRLQTDLQAAGVDVTYSYVSLTEVSEYAQGLPDEMKQARLYPNLPPAGMTAFCFYPMSKRRGDGEGSNWFSLPYESRKDLMLGHGAVGRTFHGPDPPAHQRLRPGSTTGSGASPCSACIPTTSRNASTPCASTRPRPGSPSSARS